MADEDFIYNPDTAALVLQQEALPKDFIKDHPGAIVSKPLTGDYVILYLNKSDINNVINGLESYNSNPYPMAMGLLDEAELEASGIVPVREHAYLQLRGSGVLLGFVDTGIDYTNKAFIYEDGTSKIQYIWDQSIKGAPPEGYLYGSEYNRELINHALASANPRELVPHIDTVGHGTFLASVAGGRQLDNFTGAAPDAEIIAVKLRKARPAEYERYLITPSVENVFSSDDFMLGIQYIVEKAKELGRPVAICCALGTNQGGHDGLTTLERYLSRISGIIGVVTCVATGNEGQARHHAQGKIELSGDSQTIELRAGDRFEDVYITIWNNASDRLSVAVRSPSGEQVARVPARSGIRVSNDLILERSTVIVEYVFPIEGGGGQLTRVKMLAATPGVWVVTVYGDSVLDGAYHAWLPMTGFIDPDTVFLSPSPHCTITTPAVALGTVTCGAYDSRNNSLYPPSSWGPSRLPSAVPDLTAPGVEVGGIYPASYGRMSGTSPAAAITAGACALLLQWGIVNNNDPSLNSYSARAYLIGGCEREANIVYPNDQWGYGRLNLMNTFMALRTL
ncbi:MAG: S8 family peptidase [Clostridiales bacterium]|jgi:subtilisin family serine protease|nr:S8 family peptidase [Clostridiales bacterium]